MKIKDHIPDPWKMVESGYDYFGPYPTEEEWKASKDVLRMSDEFQEPPHYKTTGAGVVWSTILNSRIGGKPCKECRYRRKIKQQTKEQ